MIVLLSPFGSFSDDELTEICIRLQAVGIDASVGHDFPCGSLRVGGSVSSQQIETARRLLGVTAQSWSDATAEVPGHRSGEIRVYVGQTEHRPPHSEVRCVDYVSNVKEYFQREHITHWQYLSPAPKT